MYLWFTKLWTAQKILVQISGRLMFIAHEMFLNYYFLLHTYTVCFHFLSPLFQVVLFTNCDLSVLHEFINKSFTILCSLHRDHSSAQLTGPPSVCQVCSRSFNWFANMLLLASCLELLCRHSFFLARFEEEVASCAGSAHHLTDWLNSHDL